MRWLRTRSSRWAAWLGVVALVLNALVPVHLAFDLAEALEPAHHGGTEAGDDFGRRLIALFAWHHEAADDDGDHHGGRHHDASCPVCSALGSLAAVSLPAPMAIASPAPSADSTAPWAAAARPAVIFAAAYRSRAPPLA